MDVRVGEPGHQQAAGQVHGARARPASRASSRSAPTAAIRRRGPATASAKPAPARCSERVSGTGRRADRAVLGRACRDVPDLAAASAGHAGRSVAGDEVGHAGQHGGARSSACLPVVRHPVQAVHRVHAQPAQRLRLPARGPGAPPTAGGQLRVASPQHQVAQGTAGEVGRRSPRGRCSRPPSRGRCAGPGARSRTSRAARRARPTRCAPPRRPPRRGRNRSAGPTAPRSSARGCAPRRPHASRTGRACRGRRRRCGRRRCAGRTCSSARCRRAARARASRSPPRRRGQRLGDDHRAVHRQPLPPQPRSRGGEALGGADDVTGADRAVRRAAPPRGDLRDGRPLVDRHPEAPYGPRQARDQLGRAGSARSAGSRWRPTAPATRIRPALAAARAARRSCSVGPRAARGARRSRARLGGGAGHVEHAALDDVGVDALLRGDARRPRRWRRTSPAAAAWPRRARASGVALVRAGQLAGQPAAVAAGGAEPGELLLQHHHRREGRAFLR